jgi:hypothetical protein
MFSVRLRIVGNIFIGRCKAIPRPLGFGHWNWLWIGLALVIGVACSPKLPFEVAPTALPTLTATATLVHSPVPPTPTATLTPTPTPTPTPIPTPDVSAIHSLADAGMVAVGAPLGDTATLICLRYEDTDGDGAPEWLALAHQNTTPPRLSAFILDGDAYYSLEPAYPKAGAPDVGLGQYPTCEVEVHDVNADGTPEIAIFGHADNNETFLHLYTWDDATPSGYRRLGYFSGDAGVRFVDLDGDLEEEIWEGHREREAPSLAWYVIFTWEEQTYGWTSDRFDWYALNRPQTYPTHKPEYAVIAFYLALDDRDLPGAYNLLFPQEGRTYETWALGFATTARVSVGSVHTIPGSETENSARVAAMVRSWDNEGGMIIGRLWNTEWATVRTGDGWRLTNATAELLEEWAATYWP